jgi:mRNA interferase MazF
MLNKLIIQLFDNWNIVKQKSHFHQKIIGIKERDIVFVRMGQNVGYEQDGKGDEFLRPVVIMKKFNKNMFLALPLTTKKKENIYHYEFSYTNKSKNNITNSAILSQVKMFDTKRVKYKSGVIKIDDFKTMYKNFVEVTRPEVVTSP